MRGNFRVWPASLGCRRGFLRDLLTVVVPGKDLRLQVNSIALTNSYLEPAMEFLVPSVYPGAKPPSWRSGGSTDADFRLTEEELVTSSKWQLFSLKVQSTGMYGPEFASLVDVVEKYQTTQTRPVSPCQSILDFAY